MEESILHLGKRTPNARRFLNLLYTNPMVSAAQVAKELEVKHPTANALIANFLEMKILRETTGQQRGRLYAFDRYLSLFLM